MQPKPMATPIDQWRNLVRSCLARRIEVARFCKLVNLLSKRAPLPEEAVLVDVILESRAVTTTTTTTTNCCWYDPLIPLYIDALTRTGRARFASVLNALRRHSSVGGGSGKDQAVDEGSSRITANKMATLMTDTRVVHNAIVPLSTPGLSLSSREVARIFTEVSEWILALVRAHSSSLADDHQQQQQPGGLLSMPDVLALFESLGILLIAVSATEKGIDVLSSDLSQGIYTNTLSLSYIYVDHSIHIHVYLINARFQNPARSCSHCVPIFLHWYIAEFADSSRQSAKGVPTVRRACSEGPRGPDDGRHEHECPSI